MSVIAETLVRLRAETSGVTAQVSEEGSRAGRAFAAAFNRSSRGTGSQVEKEMNQATRGAVAGSGAFTGLGRSLAFASVTFLGTAKAVDVVKNSLHEAVDEQKQLERGVALFKSAASGVNTFAEGAAKSLGQSHDEALKFTNDLGQMLVPLGIAPARAADLSVQLDKLVGNLSAMRNEDPSIVLNKIEAGLRGRGMGLKAYGIQISDATLKEEALRLGLIQQTVVSDKVTSARTLLAVRTAQLSKAQHDYLANSTQVATAQLGVTKAQGALDKAVAGTLPTLTQQQKSLAATNLILQQGSRYQDEFGKHSGDLANKERVLHAEIKNLEEVLGKALLPEISHITGAIADWAGKSDNQARVQRAVISAVHDTVTALHLAWDAFNIGVAIIKPVVDAVGGLGSALKLLLAYKIASWVSATVIPAMGRASAAWTGAGAAATEAAAKTTAATAVIERDMAVLSNSSSALAVKNEVASIGTAAQTSSGKVSTLRGGLSRLGSAGKVAVPIALITTVTNSGGSPWSAAVQGAMLGLLFGGPEAAIVAAAASATLNVIVNYIRGSGSADNPVDHVQYSRTGTAKDAFGTKIPIVQAQGNTGVGKNSKARGYITNVAREMWASGESRLTIYNALVNAGYNPGVVAQAVIDATNDNSLSAARAKVLQKNRTAAVAVTTAGAGGVGNPVPGGGSIIGTPGVGTHNQSDWESGNAIDVTVKQGSPVLSPVDGVVTQVDPFVNQHGSGTKVIYGAALTINGDGNRWFITHLLKVTVAKGQPVRKGQQIGIAGALGHVHIGVESGSPMQIPGLTQGDKGGSNTVWSGGGGAGVGGSTGGLVVGSKAPKPLFQPVSTALQGQLDTAQRGVTRARAFGGTTLEDAMNAEIVVDNRLIAAAKKAKTSSAAQRKQVHDYIEQRKNDIVALQAQIKSLRVQEEKQQERDAARLGAHDDLVTQTLASFGLGPRGGTSHAADSVVAAYQGMSDKALRGIIAARKKAKADLARAVKTAGADVKDANDLIGSLLGMDQNQLITYTDKWGRQFTMSIGKVVADAQKAMRDLKAAIASGNKDAILAAIKEWKDLTPEISQAVTDAVAATHTAFDTAFGALSNRVLTAFDRETQRQITEMSDANNAAITVLQTNLSDRLASMQEELRRRVSEIQAKGALLTVSEQAIKNLQAGAGADTSTYDLQQAHAALLAAKQGSPEAIAAQRQIDALMLQQKISGLQNQADAERTAQDKETQRRIDSLTKQEQAREKELTAEEAALEKSLNKQEVLLEQNLADGREAKRLSLEADLAGWAKGLQDGSKTWADFTAWLKGEGASGDFGPNPVLGMTEAGQAQGSAFATAYVKELGVAYAAQQALANGQDPAAAAAAAAKKNFGSTGGTGHGIGKQGFLGGGEIPGPHTGRDDKLVLASGGETVIDERLTDAMKQAFLGGQGFNALAELLFESLLEHRKQTALLASPINVSAKGRTANDITFEASR